MSSDEGSCVLRRRYEAATLVATHPPKLVHPNKRAVYERCCPPGARHAGEVVVTRWRAAPLPGALPAGIPEVTTAAGPYDYAGDPRATWHVNFADPRLFAAYGSGLLAQDELQVVEHPVLGAVREALLAEGHAPLTEENDAPTPVLVLGAERRCALETGSTASSPLGLYGNRFAAASPEAVRRAVTVLDPAPRTNLIAIAAPTGGPGPYWRRQLERILVTAYTGFRAAVAESQREWPGIPVGIRTGFWGCGAFGGDRRAMTVLQVLAARLAGVGRVRLHLVDSAGKDDFARAMADLASLPTSAGTPVSAVVDAIEDLDYEWGTPDGT